MLYLVAHLWLYQVLTLVVGVIFGWWAAGSGRLVHKPLLWSAIAILVAGGLFAYFQTARGKPGLWWDIWMLLFLAYVAGCLIAFLLRAVAGTSAPGKAAKAAGAAGAGSGHPSTGAVMTSAPSMTAAAKTPAVSEASADSKAGLAASLASPAAQITSAPASHPAASRAVATGPFPTAPILFRTPGSDAAGADGSGPDEAVKLPSPAANPARTVAPAAPVPAAAAPAEAPAAVMMSDNHADHFDDADESIVAARPPGLAAPEAGKKDDLKRISGIGRVNEKKLNELGVFHFAQIATWSAAHAKWVNSHLAFPGRIQREKWVSQARTLASGADTEFSNRVKAGRVPTSS